MKKRLILAGAALAFGSWALMGANARAQTTIGALSNFALFLDGNGNVNIGNVAVMSGTPGDIGVDDGTVTLGNNSVYSRNVVQDNDGDGGVLQIGNYTTVVGECATDSGGSISLGKGASCDEQSTDGSSTNLTNVENAENDEETFECAAWNQSYTQSFSSINVAASKSFTVTDTVSGGLNVIYVDAGITIGGSGTLILSGGQYDQVVVLNDGGLTMGYGSHILLSGGLQPQNVYITGNSLNVQNSSVLNGTIESENAGCTLGSGVTANGALICEGDTNIGPNLRLNFFPTQISLSVGCND